MYTPVFSYPSLSFLVTWHDGASVMPRNKAVYQRVMMGYGHKKPTLVLHYLF